MSAYQVIDWEKHFENNKSRERDRCSFVCVPNKQDGMGLTRILALEDGAAIYGIWCLIIGALSRQRRPRDGWLTEDGHQTGTPWAPDGLSLRWRRTTHEITRALGVLSSSEIGWIKAPAECPSSALAVPAQCPSGALEGKGKKGKNGREGKEPPLPPGGGFGKTRKTTPEESALVERWIDWAMEEHFHGVLPPDKLEAEMIRWFDALGYEEVELSFEWGANEIDDPHPSQVRASIQRKIRAKQRGA